jgi:hypothetical protein
VFLLWLSLAAGIAITALEMNPIDMAELEELAGGPWASAIIWGSGAFAYAVMAMLIFFASRRANWARVLLLLLTIFGAALMLYPWSGVDAGYWGSFDLPGVTFLAADCVALYWLFSGAGAAWYARRNERAA